MTKFIFTDLMDIVKITNIYITTIQKKQEHWRSGRTDHNLQKEKDYLDYLVKQKKGYKT